MPDQGNAAPVFSEPTGRRWQRVRVGAILLGAASILAVVGLIAAALLPPVLPKSHAFDPRATRRPAPVSPRDAQAHDVARGRLYRELRRGEGGSPARAAFPTKRRPGPPASDSILAGFYVGWDEHSYESLVAHVDRLDWVIAEWSFIAPTGDSLKMWPDQNKMLELVRKVPADRRPKVLLMVTNVEEGTDGRFGGINSHRLLVNPAIRRRAAQQLAREVRDSGFAGVTVDFESVPDSEYARVADFLDELRAALGPNLLLTQAIQVYLPPKWVRIYADKCDKLILMVYDQHYQKDDPGPIASREWFTQVTDSLLAAIPSGKAMMGIAAYGADWSDKGTKSNVEHVTAGDVWQAARAHHVLPMFDTDVNNPWLAWTDADAVDHFVWYMDATTAADEMRIARARGVTSAAVWRLGGEDPSMWRMFGRHGEMLGTSSIDDMDPAYNVRFPGDGGDLLTVLDQPLPGPRVVETDSVGVILSVTTDSVPREWAVARAGHQDHEVALTFDDGPGRWTAEILDTLKQRGAPATFFLIGDQVVNHYGLTRRIVADGHEIGNHTFTHPDLSRTSPWRTRLEMSATGRLFEAILGRRTILMRTPFLGDNDPSTPDELVPLSIATQLGYITVGLSIDGEDWREGMTGEEIVDTVLKQRRFGRNDNPPGNVILLHDGGGDRSHTAAVLGRLIDSLRAGGDTIVSLGQLGNLPPDVVMPPVTGKSSFTRALLVLVFIAVSIVEVGSYWIFFIAIILAMSRLTIVLLLAAIQRFNRRRHRAGYAPPVSVVVPAFREEAVIVATVKSLLVQDYAGAIEVLVVDDGSPDDTFGVAQRAFADEPRVRVLTKANGGKATALNFGIQHATGDIIVALDADTLFDPDAVKYLIQPLADPHVGAVAGNAKVGNRINLVTRWQALEYITSQNLDRRAFALLDCIMVVPGAIGAWRKSLVLEVGGFSNDTLAEDQDLTLSIGRGGYRVAYADRAIAWTEAPDTISGLAKQRFRWAFGTLQCAWKHRDLLFRPRAGTLGFVALPNVWIFQLFFSIIAPMADLVFVVSLIGVFVMFREHNTTYAVDSLRAIVGWYGVFIAVDWVAATLAFLMEPGEDRGLTWLVFLQRFAYRQVMYFVVLRSMIAALRGGLVGWGKLDRKATAGAHAR